MKRDGKKPIILSTPPSTSRSSITTTSMDQQQQQPHAFEFTKDSSSYFPGCRKDANCTCKICLDSINATLDLLPLTTHKKTNLSNNNLNTIRTSPIPFGSPSTPTIGVRRRFRGSPSPSPCWKSTARAPPKPVVVGEGDVWIGKKGNWRRFGELVLGFVVLILGMELGFPWVLSRALKPELSAEIVRDMGERAFEFNGLNRKLRMLQSELQLNVRAQVSNCTHNPRVWEVNQNGLLLSSRCVLYKSATEEVSVWGWPLQTAGLLVSRFSSRSFTVLAGRVTQWPEGNDGYVTVKARGSWALDKHRALAVQLDGQTWVVEYSRSLLLEHERLCSAVWKFLEYNLSRAYFTKMGILLGWLAETFGGYSAGDAVNVHPT